MKPLLIGHGEDGGALQLTPDGLVRCAQGPLKLTDDDLSTHLHGVGASRTGKSKLIEWIARDWIRNRQGFCLIDPHGHLYNDLLAWLTYIGCKADILLFNPSFEGRVVGFNPFQRGSGDQGARVDRLIQATVKAWGSQNSDETPRLERWLRCIYYPMVEQGQSLTIARYLFGWKHREIRKHITSSISSDLIRDEWDEVGDYKRATEFSTQLESTRSRLFRFLISEPIRRMVGLPSNNLDIEKIIESGQILLVNLQPSDTLSEEGGRLIGTLLLNEIWQVAKRRVRRTGGRKLSAFPVVIDEFQKFLTPDVPAMLDQGAKYGIHLFLFHQHLSQLRQLDEEAYGAVMTNARIKVVFGGLSRDDALTMVREIFPGQVDLKRVKLVIEQTKFWPVYTRDHVRTTMAGRGTQTGTSMGVTAGLAWDPSLEQWTPSATSFTGELEAGSKSWAEGTADIPIFYPVPFKEVSSIQFYSLEDTLWQLADRLMEQYQRHFMIRRPGQPTVAAITPKVAEFYVKPERVRTYIDRRLEGFLTPQQVDAALDEIHRSIAELAAQAAVDAGPQIESSKGPTKRRIKASSAPPAKLPAVTPAAVKDEAAAQSYDAQLLTDLLARYRAVGLPYPEALDRYSQQALVMYSGGHWDESIFNHRRFLEGMLLGVAESSPERPLLSLRTAPGARAVRDYLKQWGVLDKNARRTLAEAYGLLSDPLHPTSPPATREYAQLSLNLANSLGTFVLGLYEAAR